MAEDELPVEWVPALTSAALRLEIPTGSGSDGADAGAGVGLGLAFAGTEAGRAWSVRVASAAPEKRRVTMLLAGVTPELGLVNLPLVGRLVPAGAGRLSGLVLAARSTATQEEVRASRGRLDELLKAVGHAVPPPLPQNVLVPTPAALGLEIEPLGSSDPLPLWIPLGGSPEPGPRPGPGPERAVVGADGPGIGDGGGGGGGTAVTAWVTVDRTLGPLRVRRAGVRYLAGPPRGLAILLDASLAAGGIVFETTGLGATVEWERGKPPAVSGTLDGLALSYTAGTLRASGALVRDPAPDPHTDATLLVAGQLAVTTTALSFSAAGMYAELKHGGPSVFVIASLTGLQVPLGPVVLTGLTGGFGYNARLAMPTDPLKVPEHLLLSPGKLPIDQGPLPVLKALGDTVRPESGAMWIAAGATFQVFKLVDAVAVLAVQATPGDVTVALLASATARFPAAPKTPCAVATLGLEATYRTSTGEIRVEAALDPDRSYLLDPSCRLQGGFALCVWTGPAHAGDFVVTLGGYHPAYTKPSHYPEVQRLGLHWQTGPATLTGECYAAVTPSMAMVGGRLEVSATVASVRAWLEAHVDAAVQWEPFAYDVNLGVRVGVDFDFLGHHSLEIGADLHVWGPPTAGTATVHLPLVPDITVRFGSRSASTPEELDWPAFHDRVLAKRAPQVQATRGLLPAPTAGPATDDSPLRVATDAFALAVTTPLPCTTLRLDYDGAPDVVPGGRGAKVDVRPMRVSQADLTCEVAVVRGRTGDSRVDLKGWSAAATRSRLPASAFGPVLKKGENPSPYGGDDEQVDAVTGLTLATPDAPPVDALGPLRRGVLDSEAGKSGRIPGRADSPEHAAAPSTRDALAEAARAGTKNRADLVAAWAAWFPPVDDGTLPTAAVAGLDGYLDRLWSVTDAEPLLVQ
ncbi:DUF6603 domain-containing protein [Kitasatospora sp. NPDC056651]|uniref:DUF6603 domain-containing protein n=1 Tax=Kitasatospora sp. NPDC056651 TaxID=3345892 RepID=UPI0036AE9A95